MRPSSTCVLKCWVKFIINESPPTSLLTYTQTRCCEDRQHIQSKETSRREKEREACGLQILLYFLFCLMFFTLSLALSLSSGVYAVILLSEFSVLDSVSMRVVLIQHITAAGASAPKHISYQTTLSATYQLISPQPPRRIKTHAGKRNS